MVKSIQNNPAEGNSLLNLKIHSQSYRAETIPPTKAEESRKSRQVAKTKDEGMRQTGGQTGPRRRQRVKGQRSKT